ncbi:hypothetical protein J2Y68_000724 [Paenarthrobacter nitroguajacolicus]|nr:hypothetical protein [Paenarthrobacter nitroguajacolicus]
MVKSVRSFRDTWPSVLDYTDLGPFVAFFDDWPEDPQPQL